MVTDKIFDPLFLDPAESESKKSPADKSSVMLFLKQISKIETNGDLLQELRKKSDCQTTHQLKEQILNLLTEEPVWLDRKRLQMAAETFQTQGYLAGLFFFICSLPEVYVSESISQVLARTGNLEHAAKNRIQYTASMIVSVLSPGGLTEPHGVGFKPLLSVRLAHAMVRGQMQSKVKNPINQTEMAYTLLAFSFLYLRSLRRLGIGMSKDQEISYLHFWNYVGYLVGVDENLMAWNYNEADRLFQDLQKNLANPGNEYSKRLGLAFVQELESAMPNAVLKPLVPALISAFTSDVTTKSLGLKVNEQKIVANLSQGTLRIVRKASVVQKKLKTDWSTIRFCLRVMGYHLFLSILNQPGNKIVFPKPIRPMINQVLNVWSSDPSAPEIVNRIEDILTIKGDWAQTLGAKMDESPQN